ncbi:MAG: hypothetical protein KHY12_03000 [Firmicutes bacterium]|nr:hypothetical protein [Bacillota bacterium]
MPNLLKRIFSNDNIKYEGTLVFKDHDSQKKFYEALETAYKEGRAVNVDGIESISTNASSNDSSYPIEAHDKISKFMVFPSFDYVPIEVDIDGEKKTLTMIRKDLSDRLVLESLPNSVISLSLSFSKENIQKAQVSYTKHYENAKTVKDVSNGLKIAVSLLSFFFTQDKTYSTERDSITLPDLLNHFKLSSVLFERLSAVEEELEISIPPTELNSISNEIITDINDLFVLICQKKTMRTGFKLTSTDAANIVTNGESEQPLVGTELFLTMRGNMDYELFGNKISLYTVGAAINAVVKEIIHGEGTVRIVYGDTDTKPMYVSIKAFKTEDEAIKETADAILHKEDYIAAKTCREYLNDVE